ncbi:hypothetical protein FACS189443_0080 [Planctomycetales bacterium]|nr:hypothetical protein FACS189443_0080 [Planctomycetales bacterium]
MNSINTQYIGNVGNVQGLARANADRNISEITQKQTPVKDTVSFSDEALKMSNLSAAETSTPSKIRYDLVNRIKAEIAAGNYDTPDKMDIAVDRMASRIF